MSKYFQKFPIINYANTPCVNILARVNMSKLTLSQKQSFYTFQTEGGQRSDHIAYDYYSSPYYDWLISFANQVVDPYYDYYIGDDDLNSLIINKYGSIANAQSQVAFFRTNWSVDDSSLTPLQFASLQVTQPTGNAQYDILNPPINQQKYWTPQIDQLGSITKYVRKQEDWCVSTNKVMQLSFNTIPAFTVGETISQSGITLATVVQVNASNNYIIVNNIAGTLNTITTTGNSSNASGVCTSTTTLMTPIPPLELQYWSPISYYQLETEQNEANKTIKLVSSVYASSAQKELGSLLRG